MKAMILAAGLGTRLRPLTETVPKPLLRVAGEPLIVWNLLLLRQHGIRDIMINLHYLGHLIEKELGTGSQYGLRISYSHEPVLLGTGGGIKQAEPFFGGEPFLVLNGDTLLDLDLTALMTFHQKVSALATMVVRKDAEAVRWGELRLDQAQRIVSIHGRGRPEAACAGGWMFAGVHVMHPRLLSEIPLNVESSIIEAYIRAIEKGEPIAGYLMGGYWSDIGTPERYMQAERDAAAGLIDLPGRKIRAGLS